MAVIIFGFWNVPIVRNCINPLKLFTIGWHELCHIFAVRAFRTLFFFTLEANMAYHSGNTLWWSNIENHHRSTHWRGYHCRRWKSSVYTSFRVYRLYATRGSFCPCRLGYTCGEGNELCTWDRAYHASRPRAG